MKPSSRLPLVAAAFALVAATAQAQLKPPAQPAAPATAPAPAKAEGVVSNPDFEKAGQTAAHAWLVLLDRKDWGTAWDASGAVFRQNVPLGTWMDNVPKVRDPLGAFVERQPTESVYKKTLPGRPAGDYVTSFFVAKFDKKADVMERVTTVRESDGRWRVIGYEVR
ncbi:MAG: DUF4019 domain-containing protein [Ramlibacter sp.]